MLADPGEAYCLAHKRLPWQGTTPRLQGKAKTKRNQRIMRRYQRVCHLCGLPGSNVVDHVIELADGGTEDEANLRPAHERCNLKKMHQRQRERRAG